MSSFGLILKQQWTIKISSPLFSIFSLATILVGSRDHRTPFWKGAIQGPFHQSFVKIGPVASEELIKMWKVKGRTTDDRGRTLSGDNRVRWAKKSLNKNTLKLNSLFLTIFSRKYWSNPLTNMLAESSYPNEYVCQVSSYCNFKFL